MKKRNLVIASAAAGAVVLTLSVTAIHGNDYPVTLSREQVMKEAEVTAEERKALEERGISYDDIVVRAEKLTDEFYDNESVQIMKDSKFLFLSDGSMVGGGEMYSPDSAFASYDPEKDPNAVSWDEAKELTRLRNIKDEVGYALEDK